MIYLGWPTCLLTSLLATPGLNAQLCIAWSAVLPAESRAVFAACRVPACKLEQCLPDVGISPQRLLPFMLLP